MYLLIKTLRDNKTKHLKQVKGRFFFCIGLNYILQVSLLFLVAQYENNFLFYYFCTERSNQLSIYVCVTLQTCCNVDHL